MFDHPSKEDSAIGILASIFVLILSLFWIAIEDISGRGDWYYIPLFLLMVHAYFTIRYSRNIFFILRYVLCSVIGIGCSLAWVQGGNILIAPFGAIYQTHEATVSLSGSVLLASTGSALGWHIAFMRKTVVAQNHAFDFLRSEFTLYRKLFLGMALLFISLFIYREGGFISGSKMYTESRNELGFALGAFNALIYVCYSFFLVASIITNFNYKKIIFFTLLIFCTPILAGSRGDYLIQLAILLFIFGNFNNAGQLPISKRRFPILFSLICVVVLYLLAVFIEVWRSTGSLNTAIDLLFAASSLLKERDSGLVLSMSTANQMAGHFYAVYAKLNFANEEYLYGSSYVDFIARSTPSFFGVPRPEDLASKMEVSGLMMAQGGIYEIAEAYWNFGYWGSFFIPLLISMLLGLLLRRCVTSRFSWPFYQ